MFSKNQILWLLAGTILFSACSKMYFPSSMPNQAELISKLPHFLKGTFTKKHQNDAESSKDYLEIKRFNAQHCRIYTYLALTKDSLNSLVKSMNTDSTKAELKGGTVIYSTKDSVEKIEFVQAGSLFLSPKDTLCEIDLSKGIYVDDFPNGKSKKLILKKLARSYFLNVLDKNVGDTGKDYWFVVKFDYTNSILSITNTSVHDSTLSKELDQYNKLASIKKLGSNQYLCAASDTQFLKLFEVPGLFEKEEWQPMPTEQNQGVFYIAGLVVFVLVGVVILVVRFLKRRSRVTLG
jgi:hypothetical protein